MRVIVEINQQQYKLIEDLVRERKYGVTDAEVLKNIILEFIKQNGLSGRRV